MNEELQELRDEISVIMTHWRMMSYSQIYGPTDDILRLLANKPWAPEFIDEKELD